MTLRHLVSRFPRVQQQTAAPLKALALAGVVAVAYVGAFMLRFDLTLPASERQDFLVTLPVLLVVRTGASWYWGLHRHWWRFVSVPDLGRILRSVAAGSVAFAVLLLCLFSCNLPRSILLIEPALTFLLVAGLMVASRELHPGKASVTLGSGKRVLIVGAGETGNNAARELRHHTRLKYLPVAFVDDDPNKQGALVQGVPVLGTVAEVPELVSRYGIEEVIIAMPSADRRRLREVMDICQRTAIPARILPAATDLIQGRVTVNRPREVRIEDLLGRPQVAINLEPVRPLLRDSVICITGAAGSIGSELCRQIAACKPSDLVMIDRNENNLHYLHTELAERFPDLALRPVVADVTDLLCVERLIATHRPRVIFQAAAYKHVPLMEHNPCEAVKNNVVGTRFLAQVADYHETERFVMISTDKAINPTSVMGSSKRVAEMLLQGLQRRSHTRFVIVRFGNVLGSDGSVVPLFARQIARGGPVTVTHPDVVRFFMLVDEAVHLVLHASVLGEGGEIFMLDMGEPVRIVDLATDMIRLSGLEPHADIDIRFTGLRPGEKLYEELIMPSEEAAPTSHPKILRLGERNHRNWETLCRQIADLERQALAGENDAVRELLRAVVPEYQPGANGHDRPGADVAANGPTVRPEDECVARLEAGALRQRA